jgi:hypothetical protein
VGIESTIGPREALVAAGASDVYAGVAEFVDALLAAPGEAAVPTAAARLNEAP